MVLFAGDAGRTIAFYRALGVPLEDEGHVAALEGLGAGVVRRHEQRPWGCRAVLSDPDGRPVELNQDGHCRT